jgi:putative serine protease PepD
MSSSRGRSHFLAALLGALVVAVPVVGLGLGGVFDGGDTTTVQASPSAPAASSDAATPAVASARGVTDVSALYERVRAGVVSVETRTSGGGATGSGFVLDHDGYVLTNDHVVARARSVRVRFADGGPVAAKVIGTDESSDLALLKVGAAGQQLKMLRLGSSSTIKVGQPAIAIGNPFGLRGSLTTGVVSAVGRSITAPNNFPIDNVIQTDAAINPGNSGGPLLDGSGNVIGVNAQIATTTQANSGVGFAIPIDIAKQVIADLKAGKTIKRPYLGVKTGEPTTGIGAIVASVVPGAPAQKAGLRAGDRIIAIAGRSIRQSSDVSIAVTAKKPGDSVQLRVRRGTSARTVTVKLGTRPTAAP